MIFGMFLVTYKMDICTYFACSFMCRKSSFTLTQLGTKQTWYLCHLLFLLSWHTCTWLWGSWDFCTSFIIHNNFTSFLIHNNFNQVLIWACTKIRANYFIKETAIKEDFKIKKRVKRMTLSLKVGLDPKTIFLEGMN